MEQKKIINLETFLKLGGNIQNAPKMRATYSDKEIKTIKHFGTNGDNTELWMCYFEDGTSHRYSGIWLEMEVEFVLHEKYC